MCMGVYVYICTRFVAAVNYLFKVKNEKATLMC